MKRCLANFHNKGPPCPCHGSYNPTRLWDRIRGNDSALRKSECVRNEQPSPNAAEYHSVHMYLGAILCSLVAEAWERTRTALPGQGTFPLVAAPFALRPETPRLLDPCLHQIDQHLIESESAAHLQGNTRKFLRLLLKHFRNVENQMQP